VRHHDFPL